MNWGGGWRIPTKDEWQELKNNCTLNWTFQGGKCGYRVTGSNGNSMFLPAAGRYGKTGLNSADSCGYYWSSSLHPGNSNNAHHLLFDSDSNVMTGSYRYNGMSVRPVCNP